MLVGVVKFLVAQRVRLFQREAGPCSRFAGGLALTLAASVLLHYLVLTRSSLSRSRIYILFPSYIYFNHKSYIFYTS